MGLSEIDSPHAERTSPRTKEKPNTWKNLWSSPPREAKLLFLWYSPLQSSLHMSYLDFRVPLTLSLSSEQDSIKHSNSLLRKTFIRWFLLAETSKAARICPFPAHNVYDFYFPNPPFKSRWEGMNQREIPLLLADDSSVIICIFPNLQNVNTLEKKKCRHFTFHSWWGSLSFPHTPPSSIWIIDIWLLV